MMLRRSPDRRRARQLAHTPEGPLRDYLARPFPDPSEQLTTLRLLAVDLETTGLDPARDHLLSIGFVPVDEYTRVLGLEGVLRADAGPSPAPPPPADRRRANGRTPLRSAPHAAKTPGQPRGTPASRSTRLIVRSSRRAPRQDRRR